MKKWCPPVILMWVGVVKGPVPSLQGTIYMPCSSPFKFNVSRQQSKTQKLAEQALAEARLPGTSARAAGGRLGDYYIKNLMCVCEHDL